MPTESSNGSVTYLEAIGQAMMAEMEADPNVFLIGEDVGQFGGAFKVTKGFLEKFGPLRVVDAPIAETGFTGLAAGAAPSLPQRRSDAGNDARAVRRATSGRPDAFAER